jgi:hypothetical protein
MLSSGPAELLLGNCPETVLEVERHLVEKRPIVDMWQAKRLNGSDLS